MPQVAPTKKSKGARGAPGPLPPEGPLHHQGETRPPPVLETGLQLLLGTAGLLLPNCQGLTAVLGGGVHRLQPPPLPTPAGLGCPSCPRTLVNTSPLSPPAPPKCLQNWGDGGRGSSFTRLWVPLGTKQHCWGTAGPPRWQCGQLVGRRQASQRAATSQTRFPPPESRPWLPLLRPSLQST